jgi:hypothetical protein
MRAEGHDRKEFGKILRMEGESTFVLTPYDAIHYLFPLLIEAGHEASGAHIWDYSEATACIDKLVSGELIKDELPAYCTECPLAIKEAQLSGPMSKNRPIEG